jgi:hypothetical protein
MIDACDSGAPGVDVADFNSRLCARIGHGLLDVQHGFFQSDAQGVGSATVAFANGSARGIRYHRVSLCAAAVDAQEVSFSRPSVPVHYQRTSR